MLAFSNACSCQKFWNFDYNCYEFLSIAQLGMSRHWPKIQLVQIKSIYFLSASTISKMVLSVTIMWLLFSLLISWLNYAPSFALNTNHPNSPAFWLHHVELYHPKLANEVITLLTPIPEYSISTHLAHSPSTYNWGCNFSDGVSWWEIPLLILVILHQFCNISLFESDHISVKNDIHSFAQVALQMMHFTQYRRY